MRAQLLKYQNFCFVFLYLGFFLGTHAQLDAQNIQIKGRLVDAKTGVGIPFANIALCGKALGTSSNETGDFRLLLPVDYEGDSICMSSIGYYNLAIVISPEIIDQFQEWALEPHVESLQEVVVSNAKVPPLSKIISKAIQRIPKNNPVQPYLMEGYYRDYLKDGADYQNILEAAIGVFDEGFETEDIWTRVKIYQSRYSKGFPIDYNLVYENNLGGRSGHINIVGGNTISVLMYNNPVRNYQRRGNPKNGYELDGQFIASHDLELEKISYLDNQRVYCIKLKANQNHPQFQNLRLARKNEEYQIEGAIYIRDQDYAILRLDYKVYQPGQPQPLNELRLEYKDYEGKTYLNYISFANLITLKRDFYEEQLMHYRELFINELRVKDLPTKDEFYLFSRIQQIHGQQYLNNPDFWKEYNMVLQKDFGN